MGTGIIQIASCKRWEFEPIDMILQDSICVQWNSLSVLPGLTSTRNHTSQERLIWFVWICFHILNIFPPYLLFQIMMKLCLYCHCRIYKEALRHQRREQPADNFTGSQKALVTTLLILGTFMLCWLPMCIFQVGFKCFIWLMCNLWCLYEFMPKMFSVLILIL